MTATMFGVCNVIVVGVCMWLPIAAIYCLCVIKEYNMDDDNVSVV